MKITAVIITAAKLAFGINAQYGMARAKVKITTAPVHIVPSGVFTPDAELTAHLEKGFEDISTPSFNTRPFNHELFNPRNLSG